MTDFELHPKLKSKAHIAELPLCLVLLQDEAHYPWLLLVPKRNNISKIMDLTLEDQLQLTVEMDLVQKVLWKLFTLKQLNVAAIGNKVPQLHVHIIGRKEEDPAWPGTVWDHPAKKAYEPEEKENLIKKLKVYLMNHRLKKVLNL